jgi:hypothetical protein
MGVELLVFFYSHISIPAIVFDLTKKLIAAHHLGKAFFVVLQINEIPIAKFFAPIGHFFWQNVRMAIDF